MFRLWILFPILTLSLFWNEIISKSSGVIELKDNNFDSRMKDERTLFVMFYAPWCGHCKMMKPEFEKAATLLVGNDPPVTFAKVDCAGEGKATCKKLSVRGYPTLHIYKSGEFWKEYSGGREAEDILDYVKMYLGPSTKDLLTSDSLDRFLEEPHFAVVGFFDDTSESKDAFIRTADKLRGKYSFGIYKAVGSIEPYHNKVVLYRPKHLINKFEKSKIVFEGDIRQELETFLKKNAHGLVGHRTKENANDFQKPLVVAYYNVDYEKNPKGTNYWRNRVMKAAQNFVNDFNFAISAAKEFPHELSDFGYEYESSEKPVIFARSKENKKYGMKDEFSTENFERFLKNLKDGVLEPLLKSEPIPESNDKPVKIAVAKNFDDVVTNNGKDTLIEFYAPWCGHCKKLVKIYDELGEKMKDEDVTIVKMDGSNNDVPPPYKVTGYPTIYWARKDGKASPVNYEGGRELKDFIQYIAKESTEELKGYARDGTPKGLGKKDEL